MLGHRIYEWDGKHAAATTYRIRSYLLYGNCLLELLRWAAG
jgi:hypothetical protein